MIYMFIQNLSEIDNKVKKLLTLEVYDLVVTYIDTRDRQR